MTPLYFILFVPPINDLLFKNQVKFYNGLSASDLSLKFFFCKKEKIAKNHQNRPFSLFF